MSDQVLPDAVLTLRVEQDRFWAARLARQFASKVGLSRVAGLELGLVVAELAANAVRHGGGGFVELWSRTTPIAEVEVCVVDHGPGLSPNGDDFADGFSEGRRLGPDCARTRGQGLGLGLGSVRRLMDQVTTLRTADGRHMVIAKRRSDGRGRGT